MKSDIEIARSVAMDRIEKVAERAGIDAECLDHYGKYIAKLPLSIVDEAKVKKSRLISRRWVRVSASRAALPAAVMPRWFRWRR